MRTLSKLELGRLVLCLGALVLAAGCATPVKTDYKAGTDFSRYKTFALLPITHQGPVEDPGAVLRLTGPAQAAVARELTAKGMTQAPGGQPADLAVNIRGQSLPKVDVTDYGYTYPVWTRYGTVTVVRNPSVSVNTYTERTLIIELLDTRAKELVWVGWLKKNSSRPVTAEALDEAIRSVLQKYPPSAGGSS